MLISIEERKWVLNNDLLYRVLTMTKKTDSIKLNQLHLIKKRRMQKYHARKILRAYKVYDLDGFWIEILRIFINCPCLAKEHKFWMNYFVATKLKGCNIDNNITVL